MTQIRASSKIDLFDNRYGENGTVLYRKGDVPPSESTLALYESDGDVPEKLGRHFIAIEPPIFDRLCDPSNSPLKGIAGKSIRQLAKEPGILVFPEMTGNDQWTEIKKERIFDLEKVGECIRVSTYNLVGFIGCGGLKINIHSRFEEAKIKDGRHITDYFLVYMLKKITRLNLLDLPSSSRSDISVFDLLPYLFPKYLKNALTQGIYKEYVHRKHNDANIKGVIDVSRHIRTNVPFLGRVAYNTREFSFDNSITQLIRHTIEQLKSNSDEYDKILNSSDVHDYVMQIVNATPSYSKSDRQKVIMDNLMPFSHPYYSKYAPLQKLCLAILRYDQLSYSDSEDEIHGVIFDVATLWEEYLAVVLGEGHSNIVHTNNRTGENPQFLFSSGKYPRYPDFYIDDKSCVMDAKYKRIADHQNQINRDDIHQLMSYMYIMRSKIGMIISPAFNQDYTHWCNLGALNGYGGEVSIYYMRIPDRDDYSSFCRDMETEEWLLRSRLSWG